MTGVLSLQTYKSSAPLGSQEIHWRFLPCHEWRAVIAAASLTFVLGFNKKAYLRHLYANLTVDLLYDTYGRLHGSKPSERTM
jgi:hypothetical protein